MSCHICKSTERKRGDFWYFVQNFLRPTPPLFSYILFFELYQNVPILLDRRVKCKGSQSASTSVREPISVDYQCATESRSAWKQSLIVRYVFRAELMLKLTSRRGPDGRNSRAGFGPRAGLCRPLYLRVILRDSRISRQTFVNVTKITANTWQRHSIKSRAQSPLYSL